jgi:hypothetical protein
MNVTEIKNNEYCVQLDRLTYYVQAELQERGLNGESAIDYEKIFAGNLVARLKYELAKQSNIKVIEKQFKQNVKQKIIVKTKYPTTIWQMFKEKHMPYFFIKKFPVKYKTFETEIEKEIPINFKCEVGIDLVYPEIKIPKNSHTLNFRFMDGYNFTVPTEKIEL